MDQSHGSNACVYGSRHGQVNLLKFKLSTKTGKKWDLSDSEHVKVTGVKWAGLNISEATELLVFSHITIFMVYTVYRDGRGEQPDFSELKGRRR